MTKQSNATQFHDESNTFDTLVEALDGDFLAAFRLCEYLSGLVIRIPSKMHRMKLARVLIEIDCSQNDVRESTGISRASYYNLARSYREECREDLDYIDDYDSTKMVRRATAAPSHLNKQSTTSN